MAANLGLSMNNTIDRVATTHPVSMAELARRASCSRSAVTRAARAGALSPALLPGELIDAAHPAVAAWAARLGLAASQVLDPAAAAERVRRRRGRPRTW
jgi:hypothetical protein